MIKKRYFLILFWAVITYFFNLGFVYSQNSSNLRLKDNDKVFIEGIDIQGNNKTKDFVILRELELKEKEYISESTLDSLVKQSVYNLKRTPLFNFVNIETQKLPEPNHVKLLVKVVERWYIWPIPVFQLADRNINEWWRKRDFSRVDYGIFFHYYNFRGRNELLRFLTQFGYEQKFSLSYRIPYINKARTLGAEMNVGFSNLKEVSYSVNSDKLENYVNRDHFPEKNIFANFSLKYRKDFNNSHSLELGFFQYEFSDTLLTLNPKFSYEGKDPSFMRLLYVFKSDFRDQKSYPLDGYYFDASFAKIGLGIMKHSPDLTEIKSTFDFYKPINKRFFFASNLTGFFSYGTNRSFYLERGLGYGNDFIRGYEHFVVHGDKFALMKNNFKFALIPTQERTLPFLKSEKFNKIHYALYLNAFIDVGYVDSNFNYLNNRLDNKLIYGYGLGLDFVTYYDVVFRLEYSFNALNQSGFFIHFTAPI
ncbi:MAG: POTRA domain-containing protein [Bacteroidales bacterium]